MHEIYVKLLDEGTIVYRPVRATRLASSIYLLDPNASYDATDEKWEFPPGSRVIVEERLLSGEVKLVAVRRES